jgi:histidinol dehydrogenase
MIRTLDARAGIDAVVAALGRSPETVAPEIHRTVDAILAAVRARGDAALCEHTARLDGWKPARPADLALGASDFEAAERAMAPDVRAALEYAADRIERYRIAGVTEGYRIGGAQAVAALAYGTALVRRVDKIVGPGNIYVALAKARVFGEVGIDMVAGPSEVIVVADSTADPDWIAGDMLAQAEHDPMARALLVTDANELIPRVERALERQLEALPRRAIAEQSLQANGALIRVGNLDDAITLANLLAPEHLELLVAAPTALLPRVRHAGAVFLGGHTPEVVGDYVAGPNHVLPTAGTARFASALSAEDFVKRSSIIEYSRGGLRDAAPHLKTLARIEGLDGHGNAAALRLDTDGGKSP